MRRLTLIAVLALLLPGCAYSSAVPLDEPGAAPLDETLIGRWVSTEDPASDPVEVKRAGPYEYHVEWVDVERVDGETKRTTKRARAYVTVLDDVAFLNVQGPDDARFTFLRYRTSGNELRVRMIAEADEDGSRGLRGQFQTSAALREAVRARRSDPLLYEEEELVLRRVSSR